MSPRSISFLIFSLFIESTLADVIRTVYCNGQCTDYLHIAESLMPSCGVDHVQMNFCGTVISCNPADAQKYGARPLMNTTAHTCCYVTQVYINVFQKEHGDCDPREVVDNIEPVVVMEPRPQRIICDADPSMIGWIVACILLFVVLLETAYIVHTFLSRPQAKVAQLAPLGHPIMTARPLLVNRPLLCEP
ncbi:unnamed protein product, partial [Mesorhabditis belari]|uniref:Uncharacterized protein n=1 Tax=Mesorhabditis belari TaxID=2138241 RepID=A0AAF3J630_9BILA